LRSLLRHRRLQASESKWSGEPMTASYPEALGGLRAAENGNRCKAGIDRPYCD